MDNKLLTKIIKEINLNDLQNISKIDSIALSVDAFNIVTKELSEEVGFEVSIEDFFMLDIFLMPTQSGINYKLLYNAENKY
jgi:hypothetical protein